jgi:hypothetical protein
MDFTRHSHDGHPLELLPFPMDSGFVPEKTAFKIRQATGPSPGHMTVTITQDDRLEWSFRLAERRSIGQASCADRLLVMYCRFQPC